jgi:DNA-binding NtrC family response regulator
MKVLLIEDNPLDANYIADILQRHAPARAEVTRAGTLEEGLAALRAGGSWAAVVLDLYLPGVRGLEALDAVRAADADVPVVVLTGKEGVDVAAEAVRRGADDFLVKGVVSAQGLVLAVHRAATDGRKQRREKDGTARKPAAA